MKKYLGFLALLYVGVVNATVIDFDNLPGGSTLSAGTDLTTQYTSLGVTFGAFENGAIVESIVFNVGTSNYWSNCSGGGTNCANTNRADVLRVDFDSLVNNVSWVTDPLGDLEKNNRSIIFNAYDASNSLLESTSISVNGNAIPTAFSVSGISYIELLQPNDNWAYAIDDLSYQAAPVPEPSTFALLGVGIISIVFIRRTS